MRSVALLSLLALAACSTTVPSNGCPNINQIRVAGVCQDRDGSTGTGPNDPPPATDPGTPEQVRKPK